MIYSDLFLIVLELLGAFLLYLLAGYATKVLSSKWRICYMLPAVLCLFITAVTGYEIAMLGVYIGSVLLLAGFFKEDMKLRRYASIAAAIFVAVSVPACLLYSGYRMPDYVEDFEKGFAAMKNHYVLAEYKGIDWDALYEEYLPKFEAIDAAHDEIANCILWSQFCQKFYDGHVSFTPAEEETMELAGQREFGNDYGLSLMTLENGQTVAVNVEPDSAVSEAGIKNGTVITAWDGESIEEAEGKLDTAIMSFPDKDNETFYRALTVAGIGGDSVAISYLDDSGKEQTVTVPKLGTYYGRMMDTLDILDQGIDSENLAWSSLNDSTACLRIKSMMYDSKSYESGDHSQMQEALRNQVLALREEGVTNLIIDLRSNGGGSPHFIMAIAALLAPEGEHVYCSEGVWDDVTASYLVDEVTGKYVIGGSLSYQGENLWKDGEIIILVNAQCISAGDHFVKMMCDFDNVTVMGFTKSNGSAQAVNGVTLESGYLSFSAIPTLDADGNIFIDSDTSREIGVNVDIKIAFDEAAVKSLFDDGEDYVLQQALNYLGK